MTLAEHLKRLDGRDYRPRVIERLNIHGTTIYYAWAADWEGPARPDYAAAMADLRDNLRADPALGG